MQNFVSKFLRNESGATVIEYGLIAAGMAVIVVTVMGLISPKISTMFTNIFPAATP